MSAPAPAPASAAATRTLPVPAWDDTTNYSDPTTLPWTEFPPESQLTWLALFHEAAIAPYRPAAIAAANAYMAQQGFHWDDTWSQVYQVRMEQMLFQEGAGGHPPLYDGGLVVGCAPGRWLLVESGLTRLLATQQAQQHEALFHALHWCLQMPSALRDNLLRVSFDRLTIVQINEFGQWLRTEMGAWTQPPTGSSLLHQWFDGRPALTVNQKALLWLKLRAYVADYLWDRRVERSDVARHIDSHHNVPQAVLDHVLAPMLAGPVAGVPAPLHPRPHPPANRFPPPRTSQELRNQLTGINSEFGGINRGQPKRNASDEEEEEEEEEEEGLNASAAAAAPKHARKHPKSQ